jgi:peptidoglycan hydrolase-like protein with peptidoglycan-binding domain
MTIRVNSSTGSTAASSEPTIKEGSSGQAVVDLQKKLAAAGFSPGAADGSFGPKTDAAVRAFQHAHGLTVDGVVGPQTWGKLVGTTSTPVATGHPTLSMGSRGPAVTEMQQDLAKAGFSPGPYDGVFGQQSKNALLAFQRAHGLSADGVCGPNSWGALTSSFQPTPVTPPVSTGGSDPTLHIGESGPDVARLQQLLKGAGCDPGGVDGQFGAHTQSAVEAYQSSRGLACDGVVGPQTWHALETNAKPVKGTDPVVSGSLRQKILQMAESQVGTLETGTNQGPCTKYPNYFGRGSESWCADFVSWVNTKAGNPMNDPYCPSVVNSLKSSGHWKGRSDPQPGDMVLFDWNGDGVADHIGIVKGVNGDGSISTIEGNTENSSGQQGVWEKTRYMSSVLGFGSP